MHGRSFVLLLALVFSTFCSHARADVEVSTANQMAGVAPRLELELGPQFAWGFGNACRQTAPDASSCTGGFGMLGVEALALFRPFNHVAFGPSLAYAAVLGGYSIRVGDEDRDLSRHNVRLSAELRWYSRRVSPGGFFAALQLGVLWWTDAVDRGARGGDATASQTAPQIGIEFGSVLMPYRGVGATLALQTMLAFLPTMQPDFSDASSGKAYGYGTFVFLGAAFRLAYGFGS